MESHLEARLWNDIFKLAQDELGVPQGTIKATALIETVVAAFEMDEILWELREHSAGLNIGRWDYIFSCIKKFRANREFCLADRAQVTMTAPFMRAYALLLVKTCHRRGAPAMGGMAAKVSKELFRTLLAEELPKVRLHLGEPAWKAGKYESAAQLFDRITTDDRYVEFLTLPAYDYVA